MKRIVILMVIMVAMTLRGWADDNVQPGQQVAISQDCYGTVVPETLDKLAEYSRNGNFDMFSTFFKFGYATFIDKNMRATVVKVQSNKALVKFENFTQWWVLKDDLQKSNSPE